MDKLREWAYGLGGLMILSGVVSAALYYTSYELQILFWINQWGPTVGWTIRIGLIVLGAALLFLGRASNKK